MKASNRCSPRLEVLDDRSLMSITLTNGLLDVIGTTGADQIRVTLASPSTLQVTVNTTGESRQFKLSAVTKITVHARGGDDDVVIGPNITIPAEVHGGPGNDTILGGGGNDLLRGGTGNDSINGRGGNDTILGGLSDDYLVGGLGNDMLDGQAGNDLLSGGAGTNTLMNGTDVDTTFSRELPFGTATLTDDTPGNNLAKTFTATLKGAPTNASTNLYLGDVFLGQITTDSSGNGSFVYHLNYDTNVDGIPDFLQGVPQTLPEIQNDGVITTKATPPINEQRFATWL